LKSEIELASTAEISQRRRLARRLSLPVGLIACGLVFYLLGFRPGDLSRRLQATGVWAPFFFWIAGVTSMSLMMPKTMVSLTAGALFGTALGCPLMLLTAVTAAGLNYAIGKHWIGSGTDPTEESLAMEQLSSEEALTWREAIRRLARDAGFGLHLLVRLSPLPTTLISYSMGVARARFTPYVLAATVAVFPQFLYVHAASMATATGSDDRYRWVSSALSLSLAVTVSLTLPRVALRRLREIRSGNL